MPSQYFGGAFRWESWRDEVSHLGLESIAIALVFAISVCGEASWYEAAWNVRGRTGQSVFLLSKQQPASSSVAPCKARRQAGAMQQARGDAAPRWRAAAGGGVAGRDSQSAGAAVVYRNVASSTEAGALDAAGRRDAAGVRRAGRREMGRGSVGAMERPFRRSWAIGRCFLDEATRTRCVLGCPGGLGGARLGKAPALHPVYHPMAATTCPQPMNPRAPGTR